MKRHQHFVMAAVVALALIFGGCGGRNSFAGHHHVGDVYEVVGNLCLVGDLLKDEQMDSVTGWETWAKKFHEHFERLPPGTKVKIVSIEKQSNSSWNNGIYSYYLVQVNVLADGHGETAYNASQLINGTNGLGFGGDAGGLVTLKLVSSGTGR